MNEYAGEAIFTIKLDDSAAKKSLSEWEDQLDGVAQSGQSSAKSLSSGFDALAETITKVGGSAIALSKLGSTISDVVGAYNQYQSAMNGVSAVAQATGNSVSASFASVKELTKDGLLTQTDAAASIKNLQLYGYSVEQATELVKIFTDSAVYNRQANYSVSEAVRVTTEGIRMENSVLSDASGITKNIAKMYEDYARSLGKSTTALTSAEKQQAVFNGVLAEGGVFAGNAERYVDSLAGSQSKLDAAITTLKQNLGGVFEGFSPIISGLADWLNNNQALVAGIATFSGVILGAGGLLLAVNSAVKAFTAIKKAIASAWVMSKTATLGFIGLATALAGIGAAMAVSSVIDSTSDSVEDLGDNTDKARQPLDDLGTISEDTAKKIAKLEESISKLTRDYNRDLKQIAVNHEENLAELTRQIEEANVDYRRAIDERMADFNVTMTKQERSHQETVDELMTQLAFLQRYNNDYNKQKLAQVQFALNKEQELYRRETETRRAEIELQNAADKEKLDKRLVSLQQELDEEVAFMNKHRQALNSVRDVILLDEIESLQERYNEQKKDYERQIHEARIKGGDAATAFDDGYEAAQRTLMANIPTDYSAQGQTAAATFEDGLLCYLKKGGPLSQIWEFILGKDTYAKLTGNRTASAQKNGALNAQNYSSIMKKINAGGYASGGYTGRGAVDEVAGVVHRGEFVVPASDVDQSTGTPKMGVTQNFTITIQGTFATSASEQRKVAEQIVRAIKQTQQSHLINTQEAAW